MVDAGSTTTPEPMVQVHVAFRAPPHRKADAVELARRRGMTLSGLVNVLLGREVEAERASALAETPVLGAARNVTTRVLTGQCLHPIHMREQLPHHDRCAGCGTSIPRRG